MEIKIEKKKERNSSLELLRILCMIFIIFHHYAVHSGFSITFDSIGVNQILIKLMSIGGEMACNIFILISGYFLVESKFSFKRLLKLIIKIVVITNVICLGLYVLDIAEYNPAHLNIMKQPFFYGPWFIVTYLMLYIISPVLNEMLRKLDKNQFKKIIILLLIIKYLIPNLTKNLWSFSAIDGFIVMYIIGAYFKLFTSETTKNNKKNGIIAGCLLLFIMLSIVVIQVIGYKTKNQNMINNATYFTKINNIVAVITGIYIFKYFKNIYFKNKFINSIAKSSLGIYLIHENLILSSIIWLRWSPAAHYFNRKFLIVHSVLKVFSIFIICVLIDKIISFVLDYTINKLIDAISKNKIFIAIIKKISAKMSLFYNKEDGKKLLNEENVENEKQIVKL